MKTAFFCVVALCAHTYAQTDQTAQFKDELARSNYKAVTIYPDASKAGTPLCNQISRDVEEKRAADPEFFKNPDWPYQITLQAVGEFKAKAWGDWYCANAVRSYDEIRDTYRDAIQKGMTEDIRARFKYLFSQIEKLGDRAISDPNYKRMLPEDRQEFLLKFNTVTTNYNNDKDIADRVLGKLEKQREIASREYVDSLLRAAAARPKQYNGQPLPSNWIDPRQADFNFFMQRLINSLR